MAYTVKQVAGMSGVSVRTLHFYDEVGLLRPAYHGANGYRYYEHTQLLTLQQILFYRELGFELKQIKELMNRPEFDRLAALESHRKVLRQGLAHTRQLLQTIEKTIKHLKGKKQMKSQELFAGFSREQQARHEQYLVDRFGDRMRERIAQSKARVKRWTKDDWTRSGQVFDQICKELAEHLRQGRPAEAPEPQTVIGRHHQWLQQFWAPTRESYLGHSQLIVDSDLRKAYEAYEPRLPEYTAAAIQAFAHRELV